MGRSRDPAGPVMGRDEVDRALARLGAEHEAIETSLLALQDHAGRRLLEGAELTGRHQGAVGAPRSGDHAAVDVLRRVHGRAAHAPARCAPGAAGPAARTWSS